MFEVKSSASTRDTRQRNAATKANSDRPTVFQLTPDTFEVESTTYSPYRNSRYSVRMLRSDDKVFAACECEAGQNHNPCYHAMRVYDGFYSKQLVTQGAQILTNARAVGGLGRIGTKANNPGQTVLLNAGQTFEAAVNVKLTVEPR
jgi:hypothetical protein